MTRRLDLTKPPDRLRSAIARGLAKDQEPAVDRTGGDNKAGIIWQAAVITRGEALGHFAWIDSLMLGQVRDAINASRSGIKARFTHPDMSSDGLGSFLGRFKNAKLDGDVVRADLHVAESAHDTPDGDLAGYVMQLAEEDAEAFGTSIVFTRDREAEDLFEEEHTETVEWEEPDGRKKQRRVFRSPDPDNKEQLHHVRLLELLAVDAVDEPAANPGGLFQKRQRIAQEADSLLSFTLGFSSEKPALSALSVDAERVRGFVTRYLHRHGLEVVPREEPIMSKKESESGLTIEQLRKDHPELVAEIEKDAKAAAAPPPPATPAEKTPEQLAAEAAEKAAVAEQKRQTDIRALCKSAGMEAKAEAFCADRKFRVEDVREQLFDAMCKRNTAPADDPDGDLDGKKDPDAAYKKEFADNRAVYEQMGLTEEAYVQSRRVDDGKEKLPAIPQPPKN